LKKSVSKSLASLPNWTQAVQQCADPARVTAVLQQLTSSPLQEPLQAVTSEQASILTALFAGSQALTAQLQAHPDWLSELLEVEALRHPRREQGMRREIQQWLQPVLASRDYATALSRIRLFKQRQLLRVGTRDLAKLAETPQILQEISDVADVSLSTVFQVCRQQLEERFGQPWHQDANGDWQPTEFCVIGLGKLGGQELNYSSDVDVVFVYSEEGFVLKQKPKRTTKPPETGMSSHQFFKRLAEAFVAEVLRATSEGILYRIDLRLRPEGDAGPLVRSLGSYENFYAQWGQTWERMMLIKARKVAGDTNVAGEFMEMIQPFRYPRSLNEHVLQEISAMKDRIETEVVRSGELDRNVKLGRGGIREIEFIAQTLQLLNAGRLPFLQGGQTLPALEKLVQYNLLEAAEAKSLAEAYCFLRDIEHRLQMENNLQTHTIPTGEVSRERLARLMAFSQLKEFEEALRNHTRKVRQSYDKFLKAEGAAPVKGPLPRNFKGAEAEWKRLLAEHSFTDVEKAFRLLMEFANGPGYGHVSMRTTNLAFQLIPKLFSLCRESGASASGPDKMLARPALSDPDRVLARVDSFISAYGTRAMLFEIWASNPSLFELLLMLFDRSEFLAEIAIRTPDLVDELVLSGRLRRSKSAEETLADLRHGLADADQKMWIRRYHQAEFMRLGLRDILGIADFEQNMNELSALADACLQYALEVVLKRHKLKRPPLAILGLGKLGGQELTYGSDLDIIFVAEPGAKQLPKLQKLAIEVMDLLSTPTEHGLAFITDARLRPDGEKGLLVNALDAYEEYYRQRAQLWEIQALTRVRPVAGEPRLGEQFVKMTEQFTNFSQEAGAKKSNKKAAMGAKPKSGLAAWAPDWKQKIAHMRGRVEKERTPPGQDVLAIKTGSGGLMDAEFLAQAICLEHGWHEANTLKALLRAKEAGVLDPGNAEKFIESYRKLQRVEGILRRWSFEGEAVLPVDPAPFYRVSVRCGFASPEAFREAIVGWRNVLRKEHSRYFGNP
jgi:[glutamine synthetase] adenylyltransferase / [glutamine synthetase]-adenylyl-L-tyrosine phosphorylase